MTNPLFDHEESDEPQLSAEELQAKLKDAEERIASLEFILVASTLARDDAWNTIRIMASQVTALKQVKDIARTYESAYEAFGYLLGNALEHWRDDSITFAEVICTIEKTLELYDLALMDIPDIKDVYTESVRR